MPLAVAVALAKEARGVSSIIEECSKPLVVVDMGLYYHLANKHSYGKSPFIEDFPMKNADFFHSYVSLPEVPSGKYTVRP